MVTLSVCFLTLVVLRVGAERVGLVNVYSSACDTSDSQAAVKQAADHYTTSDTRELKDCNLTVIEFDTNTIVGS